MLCVFFLNGAFAPIKVTINLSFTHKKNWGSVLFKSIKFSKNRENSSRDQAGTYIH